MQRRAIRLLEIRAAAEALQLAPWPATGMAIRANIAPPYPITIVTTEIGAKLSRGIHLTPPSTRGDKQRRRCRRWLEHGDLSHVLAGRTEGLVEEPRKRCGLSGALWGWLWQAWVSSGPSQVGLRATANIRAGTATAARGAEGCGKGQCLPYRFPLIQENDDRSLLFPAGELSVR